MIYSMHDVLNGGFRYFEAPGATPINDDLPTPNFPVDTPLGVPSSHAGRAMPGRTRPAGSGQEARGIIVRAGGTSGRVLSDALPSGLGKLLPSGLGTIVPPFGGSCPHWQRATSGGECVDRWWAGPPISWLGSGLGYAVGGAIAGVVTYLLVRKD